MQNGITVAGGNGSGSNLSELNAPWDIYVYDNETIYVADNGNHRIMKWKSGETSGQIVADGNGPGNRTDQLNKPTSISYRQAQ